MKELLLYPTETVYGLGVSAFDQVAWQQLCALKGRSVEQTASWLVRSISDIERLSVVTDSAKRLIDQYLPGPLTLVLQASPNIPTYAKAKDGTVSFRISSDPVAQQLIADYMEKNGGVPLTCTSANVHGAPTEATVEKILEQFGTRIDLITEVIDGGARCGESSTVVRCVGDTVEVLRQGSLVLLEPIQ